MADMTTIKGRIAETIYPNGQGAITAESHQALLLEMVDDINTKKADQSELIATRESLDALEQKVDNLPRGEEFDKEGNYPLLHVGTADDLAGRGESVPAEFGFRASGGKSIKDGRAYIKRIKGNSVVWNQKLNNAYQASGIGGWYVRQGQDKAEFLDNSVTWSFESGVSSLPELAQFVGLTKGHKYLFVTEYKLNWVDGGKEFYLILRQTAGPANSNVVSLGGTVGARANQGTESFFFESQYDDKPYLNILPYNITNDIGESATLTKARVIDLTQLFQAGNEPKTIEDFYARVATLGVDMNAYNEGQVIHCNTESIKSVGDNAWDEEWELGYFDRTSEQWILGRNYLKSKNLIPILPNTQYRVTNPHGTISCYVYYDCNKQYLSWASATSNSVFQTPSSACYMYFQMGSGYGITYNNDICISLVHSGWKQDTDAGYQPYWQDTLPLPIIRKYFPQGMKSAGTAHDEIRYNKASGKWEAVQRIKDVKMKDLYWSLYTASGNNTSFMASLQGIRQPSTNAERIDGALIAKYSPTTGNPNTGGLVDKCWLRVTNNIYIKDDTFASAEAFVNSLKDNDVIYYELAEPIVTVLDAEDQNFRDYYNVADFGTEMSQSSVPSTPFSADIIYQFNAVDMIREHELEITELQSIIATMQAQLTSLINGGQ